jgi:GntR family transcriptional regulator/MocR family aminotransferase
LPRHSTSWAEVIEPALEHLARTQQPRQEVQRSAINREAWSGA